MAGQPEFWEEIHRAWLDGATGDDLRLALQKQRMRDSIVHGDGGPGASALPFGYGEVHLVDPLRRPDGRDARGTASAGDRGAGRRRADRRLDGREIAQAHALAQAAHASDARWRFADWLLAALPWGTRGRNTGVYARIDALAEVVEWSASRLCEIRETAWAWPRASRVREANLDGHVSYRRGGPGAAEERRE